MHVRTKFIGYPKDQLQGVSSRQLVISMMMMMIVISSTSDAIEYGDTSNSDLELLPVYTLSEYEKRREKWIAENKRKNYW